MAIVDQQGNVRRVSSLEVVPWSARQIEKGET